MQPKSVGVSGLAAYVPPYRVCLKDWCDWTGNSWDKINAIVGSSFRIRGFEQSIYTLAATAVLRLIQNYDVDPSRVGYLAFGTESSTDNAAGAVIIKGMVNQALAEAGSAPLPRDCEVPELKHACLGGIYAMKGALRYLSCDGVDRQAIVVSADLAEYERGSSGEQTQGAGAIAMLMESEPRLFEVDLRSTGKSSDYRGNDFRKPFVRFAGQTPTENGRLNDFPVFNGPFSTDCYLEATLAAVKDMLGKRTGDGAEHAQSVDYFKSLPAVFMHRPYRRMPETGLALCYLFALCDGTECDRAELASYCELADERAEDVIAEISTPVTIADPVRASSPQHGAAYPHTTNVLRAFRNTAAYQDVVLAKQALGADLVAELGNLYTASLPAWLAAGFEDALARNVEFGELDLLMVGYGSGDAAEAIPFRVVANWQTAASRIGLADALGGAVTLSAEHYAALHEGAPLRLDRTRGNEFVVARIGDNLAPNATDTGIEYYEFVR